jgi:hypothetical protein
MIKSEKKLKDLTEIFNKDNNILISGAINILRDEQPFQGAVGILTALYDRNTDISVRKTIAEFMNDLKDQSVTSEVITEIMNDWKPETITMLVASCWHSGLNYSDFLPEIAKLFLRTDFISAFECFTLIEETVNELDRDKKEEISAIIQKWPLSSEEPKRALTQELILLLKE